MDSIQRNMIGCISVNIPKNMLMVYIKQEQYYIMVWHLRYVKAQMRGGESAVNQPMKVREPTLPLSCSNKIAQWPL